ncbi:GtrA family protein [Pseudanabaena sp. FACHB-1998]|uniref:GtrA family protein n=1 Tax=Pseudanabaena sp. FACHB-1998 TaxID=2692858 RepID=UPI0016807EEC|nr:GtrA family protein [Pseudanabaena sp. FACHB-1998]MBD2178016.1 GtrA family protein [Pseudanabaena sp. FACHB-1998]
MKNIRLRIKSKILDRSLRNQFLRFFLVGGFCASLNLIILYTLTDLCRFHYLVSILIQNIVVNSIGFYLNRAFTFKNQKDNFLQGLIKYHMVMVSSLLIVSILMYLLVDIFHVWYMTAFIFVTIIMIAYNFISHKKWTFNK